MKHLTYFELLDALCHGCPICHLVGKTTKKWMDGFLYESVNDPELRQKMREAAGFCNRHAWQLRGRGDPLGQSIVYEDLLRTVVGEILRAGTSGMGLKTVARRIGKPKARGGDCVVCVHEGKAEERYVLLLARYFGDPELRRRYRESSGVCLPHLGMLIRKWEYRQTLKEILEAESDRVASLLGELQEFLRKQDYRFSGEPLGTEREAWIRAVEKIAGKEGLF